MNTEQIAAARLALSTWIVTNPQAPTPAKRAVLRKITWLIEEKHRKGRVSRGRYRNA